MKPKLQFLAFVGLILCGKQKIITNVVKVGTLWPLSRSFLITIACVSKMEEIRASPHSPVE